MREEITETATYAVQAAASEAATNAATQAANAAAVQAAAAVSDAAYGSGSEEYYFDSAVAETYPQDDSLPADAVEPHFSLEDVTVDLLARYHPAELISLMSLDADGLVSQAEFQDFWNIYLTMEYNIDASPYLQGLQAAWSAADVNNVANLDTEGMTKVLLNICGSRVEECK